tara:strand:- start:1515 stop:2750 length:1236 start_codon:yes stop_codon:yes gene_type:complete
MSDLKQAIEEQGKAFKAIEELSERENSNNKAIKEYKSDADEKFEKMIDHIGGLEKTISELTRVKNTNNGTNKDEYYGLYSKSLTPMGLSPVEKVRFDELGSIKKKDFLIGTGTSGGNLVPEDMADEVLRKLREISPIRDSVRVVPTMNNDLTIPTLSNTPIAAGSSTIASIEAADLAGYTEGTYTSATETITAFESNVFVQASLQSFEDMPDAQSMISDDLTEAMAAKEGSLLSTGAGGSTAPQGLGASIAGGTSAFRIPTERSIASGTGLTFDDLNQLVYEDTKTRYYRNGQFMMSHKTLGYLLRIKDEASGVNRYLFQPRVSDSAPGTIMGFPIVLAPDFPDWADAPASDGWPVCFGDFKAGYWIAQRVGLQTRVLDQMNFPLINIVLRSRWGGGFVKGEAISRIKNAS